MISWKVLGLPRCLQPPEKVVCVFPSDDLHTHLCVPTLRMTILERYLAALLVIVYWPVVLAADEAQPVDFNSEIRPLLSDRCYTCHGPDEENREADLRLDIEEYAKESVIVPGDRDASELYLRVSSTDPDVRMPPADSKLSLSDDEIQRIGRWIEQGAKWNVHWSFVPPRPAAVPEVGDPTWPRNAIDRFILAQLDRAGLTPAPSASPEKLIRRATFDLTGLPPSLDQLDVFLSDPSPDAYERLIDRLLASEAFGERMAAAWLDVARYSDTYGYQVDRDRFVWPWRDWVIKAFNTNMPYDEFATWQLAGDLLPDATDEQILATTFNRLHPQKVEGGSVPEEFRIEYVADRNQTFATAFLGLTLECARCHDHKYDPITQREYYQLTAFFDKIDEAGLYSYFTNSIPTPTLLLLDDAKKQELNELNDHIADEEAKLAALRPTQRAAFEQWLQQRSTGGSPVRVDPPSSADHDATADNPSSPADRHSHLAAIPGQIAHLTFEDANEIGGNQLVPGYQGNAVKLTGDDAIGLNVGNFARSEPFSISLWMNTPDEKERAVVFHRSRAWTDAGSRGYQLLIEDGCLSASLIHFWPGNAIRVRTIEKVPLDQWFHVTVTYDGSSQASGLRIYVDGELAGSEAVRDSLYKNISGGGGDNIAIGERFRDRGFTGGLVDEFRVFSRELTAIEVSQLHDGVSLQETLATPADALSDSQKEDLFAFYLATADRAYQDQLASLQQTRQKRNQLIDGVQEIMVMRETPAPRQTYLLKRGAYDAHGDAVDAATPAVFGSFPADQPRNRLGLARWLTSPEHPLTARVAVNRLWQLCFGEGLVRTAEDFGSQGDGPSHPQLLDWLAQDFVTHNWDVKRLLKQITTSATYRQSSQASRELLARDPQNRLLARAPSYRWGAEMLRDNVLLVSGLLVDKLGGAPVRPYEVEESFKPVKRDQGDGLYRRSVYTYWKRTGPAPAMMTLDAAKRDVCRVRRERTSSPLQAFVLLNDPQFVEAAKMLAQRMIAQHGDDTDAVLRDIFRTLTSRLPSDEESLVLHELFAQQRSYFHENPSRATEFLATGDAQVDPALDAVHLAAMGVVANTLMNYDECVMKK